MKNILLFFIFLIGVLLWGYAWVLWATGNISGLTTAYTTIQAKITSVFNTNPWKDTSEEERRKIKAIFLKEAGQELSGAEVEKFTAILQKEVVQDDIYTLLKQDNIWKIGSIALALLLWIGYAYAYGGQMAAQLTKHLPINIKSFVTFWSISGMMTILNGLVPGSLVYFESFILAFASVAIHQYNKKCGMLQEGGVLERCARNAPFLAVWYNKEWSRIIWNKRMEEETWYNYADITEYYGKNGDIVTLICEWEHRGKVGKRLEQITRSWEGYENFTSAMTTKSWGEKTFHWTAFHDGHGGIMCIAEL